MSAVDAVVWGIISSEMVIAAGALMRDAVSRLPTALGITGSMMVA